MVEYHECLNISQCFKTIPLLSRTFVGLQSNDLKPEWHKFNDKVRSTQHVLLGLQQNVTLHAHEAVVMQETRKYSVKTKKEKCTQHNISLHVSAFSQIR